MATDQVWTLQHAGRLHRVVAGGSMSHEVRWFVDDQMLAEKKTWDDKVIVPAPGGRGERLLVRYSGLGTPTRATLYGAGEDVEALTGLGGLDLVPDPDSRAAAYEDRVRAHPTRYAALATLGGVAKVVVPLLLGLVAVRFAVHVPWPDVPWPHLPSIPWPSIPWPSIPWPSVPWPDVALPHLPDWGLPGWLGWLLDKAKYVWPVVLAYALARAEIRRRRAQDERRRSQQDPS